MRVGRDVPEPRERVAGSGEAVRVMAGACSNSILGEMLKRDLGVIGRGGFGPDILDAREQGAVVVLWLERRLGGR